LKEHGIKLARRYSGGGTVYHDLGNLNITFMTSRSRYNRKWNLECIAEALSDRWNLDVDLSPRDDLVVDGIFKISGSAAKLGKYSSYHHCTLLCDVNLDKLNKAIMPRIIGNSRATQSISSHVINLNDIESSLNVNEVITSVARTYTQQKQLPKIFSMDIFRKNLNEINQIKNELLTWEWIFGKTSPFTITKTILLPSGNKAKVDLEVQSGLINNVAFLPPFSFENEINEHLRGIRFESNEVSKVVSLCLEKCAGFQSLVIQ
jgi:lipoyltransferase 1